MPGITLRMARPEDAGGMLAVYAPYVEHSTASWEYEAPSLAEFSGRLREHLDTGFPWLLAEEDGAVLGYAYAGRFAARRATRTAGGWVFPIISSRCSRFLPCPCRLCR